MSTLQNRIMGMNFGRAIKRLIIIGLCVLATGGALTGYALRTQIESALFYLKQDERPALFREALPRLDKEKRGDARKDAVEVKKEAGHEHEDSARWEISKRGVKGFLKSLKRLDVPLMARLPLAASTVICAGLFAAYWLLVAAWLYKASALAGMNTVLWPLLGLAGNVAAVVLFLLWRSRKTRCPACGHWQSGSDGEMFCSSCGQTLKKKCRSCGEIAPAGDQFCPKCGASLSSENESEEQQ